MKNILLIAGLLLCLQTTAQKVTFFPGQQVQIGRNDDFFYAGSDEENFYIVRTEKEKRTNIGFLEGFSRKTLKRVFSTGIDVPVKNADQYYINEIVFSKDVIRVFYGFYSKQDKLRYVVAADFDKMGKSAGNATEITKAEGSEETSGNYFVYYDKQSENTLVMHSKDKRGYGTIGLTPLIHAIVLDNDLNLIWEKDITVTSYKGFDWTDIALDKSGNIYMRAVTYKALKASNPPVIITYNRTTNKVTEHTIIEPDKSSISTSGIFITDKEDHLYYVAKWGELTETYGMYIVRLNTRDVKVESEKLVAVTEPEPGEKVKKDIKLGIYGLNNIIIDDNNMLRVTMVNAWTYGVMEFDQWIVDMRFDQSLNLKKMTYVPRWQETNNFSEHNGTVSLYSGDNSYYIYNELAQNLDKSEKKGYKLVAKYQVDIGATVPCYAKVSGNGVIERKVLIPKNGTTKPSAIVRSDRTFQISNDEVISLMEEGDKFSFIRFKIEP